jgi:hypothetical protein
MHLSRPGSLCRRRTSRRTDGRWKVGRRLAARLVPPYKLTSTATVKALTILAVRRAFHCTVLFAIVGKIVLRVRS